MTKMSALKKALVNMGFKAQDLQDHGQEKVQLKGYQGDRRNQRANLVIKGSGWGSANRVGSASNDLGWEVMEDGSMQFHVSQNETGHYNANWQRRLMQQYTLEATKEVAEEQGLFLTEEMVDDQGEIHLTLTSPY
jgi:hypothetical protein